MAKEIEEIADASTILLLSKIGYPMNFVIDPTWFKIENWLWDNHSFYVPVHSQGGNTYTVACIDTKAKHIVGVVSRIFHSPILAKIEGIKEAVVYLHKQPQNKTMTKQQAISAMMEGRHVKHNSFLKGEALEMHGDFRVYTIGGQYTAQDKFPESGWEIADKKPLKK